MVGGGGGGPALRVCLRQDQHLHELDGVGSNSVVGGFQKTGDDLLEGADDIPDGLHVVRDHLGLGQPAQRHLVQVRHGLDHAFVHGHGAVGHHHLEIGDHLNKKGKNNLQLALILRIIGLSGLLW